MACTKHVQRKRPNSCEQCAIDLGLKKVEVINKADKKNTPKNALEKAEQEEKELVVKPERKRKPKENKPLEVVNNNLITSTSVTAGYAFSRTEPVIHDPLMDLQDKINKMIDKSINDLKYKIETLANISYEHLMIPLGSFNFSMFDTFEADGFQYRDTWKGEVARVSGCKEDTVVFVRVKSNKWKKTIKEYEEKYTKKGKK